MAESFGFEGMAIDTAVYQALGAASVCWSNMAGAGVFDSGRAKVIGDQLLARVKRGDRTPEYHDANTLDKVRSALKTQLAANADTDTTADELILSLQNAGILFRERR